jgi:hypothetical protein
MYMEKSVIDIFINRCFKNMEPIFEFKKKINYKNGGHLK